MFIVKDRPDPIVILFTIAFEEITGLFEPEVIIAEVYFVGTPLLQLAEVFQAFVVPNHVVVPVVGSAILTLFAAKVLVLQPPRSGVTKQVTMSLLTKPVLEYVGLLLPTLLPFNLHW